VVLIRNISDVLSDWKSVKKVNNMHLQNIVMQLRKVCSHPFLFNWPLDERTGQPVVDKQLVDTSGKMMVLGERLLDDLFACGHKVLMFLRYDRSCRPVALFTCARI
jgi:ATP-dependent DNA helicase